MQATLTVLTTPYIVSYYIIRIIAHFCISNYYLQFKPLCISVGLIGQDVYYA